MQNPYLVNARPAFRATRPDPRQEIAARAKADSDRFWGSVVGGVLPAVLGPVAGGLAGWGIAEGAGIKDPAFTYEAITKGAGMGATAAGPIGGAINQAFMGSAEAREDPTREARARREALMLAIRGLR